MDSRVGMRIGIDVGGTNTDAALMDGDRVVATHKTSTTSDVSSGVTMAIEQVLSASRCSPADVAGVMIGTTHFTNAVIERRRLLEVAAVRIALPATQGLPPMVDWPVDLRAALGGHAFYVHGGYDISGVEISAIDECEIRELAGRIRALGLRSIALTSVFSPINTEHEERVAEILREELPSVYLSLSGEIGRIGLLERENATILNACLAELAVTVVESFRTALTQTGIEAPCFISQNDGTLMSADFAMRYPIRTFASGPTNSMRGAAFLSGAQDAVIVDIGGTTTDIGVLVKGFPREAVTEVEIANIRTNFRMPDVISIGLGGGSLVRGDEVGPQSVGYELTARALVFGGETLTATDVAVAAGLASIGDPSLVAHLDHAVVERARNAIGAAIERGIDRIKTSADAVPVVLVGGGAVLMGHEQVDGARIIKPEHASVANAIGAAIAQAGGEVDHVYTLDGTSREAMLAQAREDAITKALAAGAIQDTVEIVDVDEIPLSYMAGNAIRLRVKAVGELSLRGAAVAP